MVPPASAKVLTPGVQSPTTSASGIFLSNCLCWSAGAPARKPGAPAPASAAPTPGPRHARQGPQPVLSALLTEGSRHVRQGPTVVTFLT
eukprot:3552822-Amphidinium_carterae.2